MGFQPTPEQAAAIAHLAGPLSISAGAGSGKTRVLAERFVRAVDPSASVAGWEPVGIEAALTVTFTDKAAGEIAERVRRVFLEHGLVAEARRVDEAWISTIHGLCSRLLRTHALEAGLDPQFGVITTVEAGALREEVFKSLLREELAAGRATALVAMYGVAGVEEHVGAVYDRLRAMGATPDALETEPASDARATLGTTLEAMTAWTGRLSAHPSPGATLLGVIDATAAATGALRELAEHTPDDPADLAREILRVLQGCRLKKSVGNAKELVLELLEERATLIDAAVRALSVPLANDLADLVRAFGERYDSAKEARGVLDFEDLQLRAVELLRDLHGPAARYRELFRLVMIDEFQDTNEVQAALADLLSDGNLCTVGDERQSIYGFRYADVDVYRRHSESMLASGAATAKLSANFRSHGDVLAFVNAVFTSPGLFGDGFLRLEHGRDEASAPSLLPSDAPRVGLLLVNRTGRAATQARSVEADAVARRLRELVDAGVPQGGIVMLLRAMTHVDEYVSALRRHGLDYTVVAGGSFFGRPEVEAVRAFLRAATNPLDDEAFAAVLASGLAGVSDDGLLRLRHAAGRGALWLALDSAGLDERDSTIAARVHGAIEAARSREGRRPVAEIIHRACEELDYDLYLLGLGPDGRHAYANVLKLARLAQEFERAGGMGTRHFLEHLALKERFRDREAPASVIDERVDAVRIMTVHSAKGLEFPVVAVPELGRDLGGDKGALLVEKDGGRARIALSLPDRGSGSDAAERRSLWASEARVRARERDAAEERRLFYVACTRAREYLLLSGAGDLAKGCGDRPLGWLLTALGQPAIETGTIAVGGAPVSVVRIEGDEPLAPPAPGRVRATAACEEPVEEAPVPALLPAAAPTPPAVSYSALSLYDACPLRYYAEKVVRIGDARVPAEDDPLRFGDAVHAALRLVGPAGEPPAPERLAAIARRWELTTGGAVRLRSAVEGFLRSEACRDAHADEPPAHEVPFAVPLAGATLVGKLDLLASTAGGALVIDYKTGATALGSDSQGEHRAQADCYALAALAGGAKTVEVRFVGVETDERGGPRDMSFAYAAGDAATLREALSTRAGALAAGPFEPLSAYMPGLCDDCPAARGVCLVKVPPRR
jgi:ATP-dependent exoDNAse (exonuclease V) beta subunit